MKKIALMIGAVLFLSCSSDDNASEPIPVAASTFKFTVRDNMPRNILSQEYGLDSEGKVVTEKFTSFLYPEKNSLSIFKYDEQGRVVKEIRNNKLCYRVFWAGDVASVFDSKNRKIGECTVSNGKLLKYVYYYNGPGDIVDFNFDSNGNVISEAKNNEVFVEYLNYDTTIANPMNIIKSIGILREYYKPFSQNFSETEKAYPVEGDDYYIDLTYYHTQKTVDSNNRITSKVDDKTFYSYDFQYN